MTIKLPYDYDKQQHKELVTQITISSDQVKAIVLNHLYKMDYYERQAWIEKHAVHKEEITEDQL